MAEITLNTQNFKQEVMESDKPILVDFWATWCGPCRMLAPIVSEIAEEYEGKVKVGKVNVDDQPEIAAQIGISSIPTLILFKNGEPVSTAIGYRPKDAIETMLK